MQCICSLFSSQSAPTFTCYLFSTFIRRFENVQEFEMDVKKSEGVMWTNKIDLLQIFLCEPATLSVNEICVTVCLMSCVYIVSTLITDQLPGSNLQPSGKTPLIKYLFPYKHRGDTRLHSV